MNIPIGEAMGTLKPNCRDVSVVGGFLAPSLYTTTSEITGEGLNRKAREKRQYNQYQVKRTMKRRGA